MKLRSEHKFEWTEEHQKSRYSFQLDFDCTDNQGKYEALIISLELLLHLGVKTITIKGNSQLVIRKLKGDYKCSSWVLASYLTTAIQLIDSFDDIDITCVLRDKSQSTNDMAQMAFRIKFLDSLD